MRLRFGFLTEWVHVILYSIDTFSYFGAKRRNAYFSSSSFLSAYLRRASLG